MSIDPNVEFPKVERMIYRHAWNFSSHYKLPFDEAKSEAFMGFMKACNSYKSGKGTKFSSWCHLVVWGQLKTLIMKRAGDRLVPTELDEDLVGSENFTLPGPARRLAEDITHQESMAEVLMFLMMESPREFTEATQDLSGVTEELFCLFLECPQDIVQGRSRKEQVRTAKEHLARSYGVEQVEQSFRELQCRLQQAWA